MDLDQQVHLTCNFHASAMQHVSMRQPCLLTVDAMTLVKEEEQELVGKCALYTPCSHCWVWEELVHGEAWYGMERRGSVLVGIGWYGMDW